MLVFPLICWLPGQTCCVLKNCLKPFVMSWQLCVSFLIFVLRGGLSILHSLICSNCNLSLKSSFSWHLEYGEVEDKIKWNPVGNLNTTSWKLLAICVNNYITSEVSNPKYLFPWNSKGFICLFLCICKASHIPCPFSWSLRKSLLCYSEYVAKRASCQGTKPTWFSFCFHSTKIWSLPQAGQGEYSVRREGRTCFPVLFFNLEDLLE